MCLYLTVYLSPADALRAKEIAKASTGIGDLQVVFIRPTLFNKAIYLRISEVGDNCACGLLADSANWDAPTWDLVPEALPALSGTVKKLRTACRSDFELEAVWAGDKSEAEARLTVNELSNLIEQGHLGNKVRYLVTEAALASA